MSSSKSEYIWGISYKVRSGGEKFLTFKNKDQAEDALIAALGMTHLQELRFMRMRHLPTLEAGRCALYEIRRK